MACVWASVRLLASGCVARFLSFDECSAGSGTHTTISSLSSSRTAAAAPPSLPLPSGTHPFPSHLRATSVRLTHQQTEKAAAGSQTAMLPTLQRALSGRRPTQGQQHPRLYSDSEVGCWLCAKQLPDRTAPAVARPPAAQPALLPACLPHCLLTGRAMGSPCITKPLHTTWPASCMLRGRKQRSCNGSWQRRGGGQQRQRKPCAV